MKNKTQIKPSLTEIIYILDRSGSMISMHEAAIAAYNHFISSQREVPGDVRFSFIQFDDRYEVHHAAVSLRNIPELNAKSYVPRGSTALLDAIGLSIHDTSQRIASLPAHEKPTQVIFAIFTDGMENSSTKYSSQRIGDLIHLHREKGWQFIFLAANQDAIATAANLNLDAHSSGNVNFSQHGIQSTGRAMSRKISALRRSHSGTEDAQTTADLQSSMEQMIREEEGGPDEAA